MNKIAIIGCGSVGMAFAHDIIIRNNLLDEIVLLDVDNDKLDGEVLDLQHTMLFNNNLIKITKGTYENCADADIVVITAGVAQKENETRQDLINANKKIIKNILDGLKKCKFKGIYLIATNPNDIITDYVISYMGVDASKVFGSGTALDTARLTCEISKYIGINPRNINAYVLGEHGDSEVCALSQANIANKSLSEFIDEDTLQKIASDVKNSAYFIISKKGNTCYGIASVLSYIVNCILSNENTIITLSVYDKENDICYSRPALLGRKGVMKVYDINLSEMEKEKLRYSINYLKSLKVTINNKVKK